MRKTITTSLLLLAGMLCLPGFSPEAAYRLKIPKKVNAIIQAKCYGCHSNEGRQQGPKDKLNWDKLAGLSADQQLEKLRSIQSVLAEGAMPPARFLEKMPDKKLTEKENARMKKWATKAVKKLAK